MMLRVLIAPNAFKGTLSPRKAAEAIQAGLADGGTPVVTTLLPVSDGGDGLIEVLARALHGEVRTERVSGLLGGMVTARWAFLADRTAVIEMAEAAGLTLVPEAGRDPLQAETRGVGELLCAAPAAGAARAVIGVGGSATVDGGAGMAQALGVRLLDGAGKEIGPGGGELVRLERIDSSNLAPRVKALGLDVACDVSNPLLGKHGAARVFGPQKGAMTEGVARLEAGLAHLADLFERDLGRKVRNLPGAGAAGGLGAGLAAFLGARLRPGAKFVLDLLDFDARLAETDLVVTGEGRLDGQTAFGKAPAEVARRAQRAGIPCVALAGSIEPAFDPAPLSLVAAWSGAGPGESVPADPAGALRALARARAKEMLALARCP